jgi:hypothetical protein
MPAIFLTPAQRKEHRALAHHLDPVVMVGKGGGKIQTGKVLDYRQSSERQMCRLYLSMMQKMGIQKSSFGDATSPLPEV